MILLTEVSDIEEYYRIKALFEMKGVLIHTGNEDSARNFGVFHPVGKYAIHVLFDEQVNDARALLLNPEHEVETPLDLSDYQSHKELSDKQTKTTILKALSGALVVLIAFLGLVFYFLAA